MEERYQIVTYHSGCGYDEKLCYNTLKETKEQAKKYKENKYESVAIFDRKTQKYVFCIGDKYNFSNLFVMGGFEL